jgi:polysaccharide biosynthesis protein PslL
MGILLTFLLHLGGYEKIMNTRLQHIEIAKGIGILLVVLGHNSIFEINHNDKFYSVIYSFHVPLFFFLSGLFLNPDGKFTKLVLSKLDSLLKPYFTIFLIMTINFLSLKHYSIISYLTGITYSSINTIPRPWIPLWFLTHLWAVTIFSWLFIKVTKLNSIKIIFQIFLLLILLVIGFLSRHVFLQIPININGSKFVLSGLPFSIDIVFISGFFFLLGFLTKQKVMDFKIQAKYFLLSFVLFCFLHYYYNYTINLWARRYDDLIISTMEALTGIYIILCVSTFISKYKVITNILSYIGSGSLFILIFHSFFQIKVSNFFTTHHNVNYFTGILAFIISSTIPLLIWELVKRNDYISLFFLPLKSNKLITNKNID